jgi:hypothetical protein
MKKLLIPFDGSESAMHAVRYAVSKVKDQPDYEAHLLHVVESLNLTADPDYWQPDVQRKHLEKGEQTIAQARQAFEEIRGTQAHRPHGLSASRHCQVRTQQRLRRNRDGFTRHESHERVLGRLGGDPHAAACRLPGHGGEVSDDALSIAAASPGIEDIAWIWALDGAPHRTFP